MGMCTALNDLPVRSRMLVYAFWNDKVTLDDIRQIADTNMDYDDDWAREQVATAAAAEQYIVAYGN